MLRFGGRLWSFEILGGSAGVTSWPLSEVGRVSSESIVSGFSSLSRSLSLSMPVGTSTRWLGEVGETGDTFPGFGDRRPLTLYVGLKGARSELTEMEEFRFEDSKGDSRPLGSERPGKLRSRGDEAGPTMVSIPFWARWSPVLSERNDGRECEELSRRELEAARPLC